jgi:hypothetical protein
MYRLVAALLARLRRRQEPTDVELLVERYRHERATACDHACGGDGARRRRRGHASSYWLVTAHALLASAVADSPLTPEERRRLRLIAAELREQREIEVPR